jgi:AcrR family transcriptional regulator
VNHNYLHRRESIILTAIDIIDELGIQGLTSKEIASREGMSEGTLFKHYKNKNAILEAVLEYYSKFDEDIIQTIRSRNFNAKEALSFYIKSYSEYYENYPAITSLINAYEALRWESQLSTQYKKILKNRSDFMTELIELGQSSKEVKKDVSPEILSTIILGFFREIILKWRINGQEFNLKDCMLETLNHVLNRFFQK